MPVRLRLDALHRRIARHAPAVLWYNPRMTHIKGTRFDLPLVQRLGLIDDSEAHRIAWNTHEGLEIHYVLRGRFTWEIKNSRKPLSVSGGHFVIIPAGRAHRAAGETGTPSFRLGVILEPFSKARVRGSSFSPDELRETLDALAAKALVLKPITADILRCLRSIRETMTAFKPEDTAGKLRLRLLSELLLVETKTALDAADTMPHDNRLMANIRKWIDRHLAEDISPAQLVAKSGYGRSRFFALFRSEIGLTPADYIVRERIARAKDLLRSRPDLPAAEIARRTGFSSPSFFALNFRKQTGLTPTAFRAGVSRGN